MRILIQHRDCGPSYVNAGWASVLRYCGHEVKYWREETALFDVWNDFIPDLVVSTAWTANEAMLKLCKRYPQTRVVLYAGTWGEVADPLDPVEYPIVKCSEEQKRFLERMKRETDQPQFVWLHVTPSWVEPILGGYREIGVKPVGITNAADLFTYYGGEIREEYRCDLGFVGGNWLYKGKNINPYLGPLLHPDSGLRCKVWGNTSWSQSCYLGLIDEAEVKHVFRSARVCPSIGEPHSLIFSDIVERYYKVPCSGGFVVGGPEVSLREEFGGDVPSGNTPRKFQELIRHYLNNEADRVSVAKLQQECILARHTYFDRVYKLFEYLNLPDAAKAVQEAKSRFLGLDAGLPAV